MPVDRRPVKLSSDPPPHLIECILRVSGARVKADLLPFSLCGERCSMACKWWNPKMLAILLDFHQIPVKHQISSVWVHYSELGHYSQVSLMYQNVYQCTLNPGVVKAYVITLLIYNLVTLLSRFIKSFP